MKYRMENNQLIFSFSGEMDHCSIMKMKPEIIEKIDEVKCPSVKFDFSEVSFIDSTGIGFILGRYNQISAYQGQLILTGGNQSVRKLFALSGLFKIMRYEIREEQS